MSQSERFALLNAHYANVSGLPHKVARFSTVGATVKALSHFNEKDSMPLPLKVTGRLITAGKYKDTSVGGHILLSPEELRKSLDKWQGVKLYKHHGVFQAIMEGDDVSIDNVVGKITNVIWNARENAIDYFAEVYDEDVAYKIMKGVINFVSVGFARILKEMKDSVFNVQSIDPKEVSLVFNPRDKSASIMPMMA